MISVFIDTFIILNLTVFTILTSGVLSSGKEGIALTQEAFVSNFGGFGDIFVAVCLLFFAFSTILGWHFFGEINVRYLFGKKAVKVYSVIVAVFIIVGSTLKVDLVWELADFFNGPDGDSERAGSIGFKRRGGYDQQEIWKEIKGRKAALRRRRYAADQTDY